MPKKRSVIAMSASYLLLKENKQEALSQSATLNQTILKEDTNTSSTHSTFQTMELSLSIFLMLTLIFFSINVSFKLIEKLLDYLRGKIHTYCSKIDTVCDKTKESSNSVSNITQSCSSSSKDHQ